MSEIKQDVLSRNSDARKSSAHANTSAVKPIALKRSIVASRTDKSSSTTEIIGIVGTLTSYSKAKTSTFHGYGATGQWAIFFSVQIEFQHEWCNSAWEKGSVGALRH